MTAQTWRKPRTGRVVLIKGKKLWFYDVIAANNEIETTSQHYRTKWNCKRAAKNAAKMYGYELVERI